MGRAGAEYHERILSYPVEQIQSIWDSARNDRHESAEIGKNMLDPKN